MRRRQKGVVSVEFALGFILFMYMVLGWAEIGFMSYISAMGDYAISEATRVAKANFRRTDGAAAYEAKLEEALGQTLLGDYFKDNFVVNVEYLKQDGLASLSQEECEFIQDIDGNWTTSCEVTGNTDGRANPIAVYQVSYDYTPVFTSFFVGGDKSIFSREVIAIQEYERCTFDTSGNMNCE